MEGHIVSLINSRKIALSERPDVSAKLQTHSTLIQRLGYSHQLEGHNGCVNCLQWNEDGSLLASGSDDLTVKVWNVHQHKLEASINSGHAGNIFSVKFMPFTGDMGVVSGAEDRGVHLHDLSTFTTTKTWSCSSGRVKRLAVSRQSPTVVWSASEDGCVRQHDTRESHSCLGPGKCRNVLIDLKKTCGPHASCKCVDVNPVRPEQIAVGAYDPYVRLYDTRVLSLSYPSTDTSNRPDPGCVAHFAPGHVSQSFRKPTINHSNVGCTYTSFSPCGNELVANLSSEHVYLYNTVSLQPVLTYTIHNGDPLLFHKPSRCAAPQLSTSCVIDESAVPEEVKDYRERGNRLFKEHDYNGATQLYTNAIQLCPAWYVLYSNRATAMLKRNWCGDIYSSLQDTERALSINPVHQKSLQRRIICLKNLHWVKEGQWYLKKFYQLFPNEQSFYIKTSTELNKLEAESNKNGFHGNKGLESDWEVSRQQNAFDYTQRLMGHYNTHTDIKEASFIGERGEYIGAGSDDGNVFLWDKRSGNLVKILTADESIANCVQWNPRGCSLATSGIEHVVKIWEPRPQGTTHEDARSVPHMYKVCDVNQNRMKLDPFEIMLMRLGLRVTEDAPVPDNPLVLDNPSAQCRQS